MRWVDFYLLLLLYTIAALNPRKINFGQYHLVWGLMHGVWKHLEAPRALNWPNLVKSVKIALEKAPGAIWAAALL